MGARGVWWRRGKPRGGVWRPAERGGVAVPTAACMFGIGVSMLRMYVRNWPRRYLWYVSDRERGRD